VEVIFPLGRSSAIGYIDNVIPQELCESIIRFFESNQHLFYVGMTVSGIMSDWKNSLDAGVDQYNLLIDNDEDRDFLENINKQIFNLFGAALESYCDEFTDLKQHWKRRFDTGYKLQKYKKMEGFYKEHCDGGVYSTAGYNARVLGSVIYLNTVSKGGGTHFPLHDLTIPAVAGRVSFFPANFTHPHAGVMPKSEDKYILSTFCYSTVEMTDGSTIYIGEPDMSSHYRVANNQQQ